MKEKWAGFKHWWINVYWYHYRWLTLGLAFAGFLVIWLIYSIATNVKSDYTIAFASRVNFYMDSFTEVQAAVGEYAGDRNGDGQVRGEVQELYFVDGEALMAAQVKIAVLMGDEEFIFMILDRDMMRQYATVDMALEPLSNLGLTADEPSGFGVSVTGWPIFERAGVTEVARRAGTEYYACFKTRDEQEMTGEVKERYDFAVGLLEYLKNHP